VTTVSWVYEQLTGDLFHNGKFIGTGYSGHGKIRKQGRNNPAMQCVRGVGPCPRGKYTIGKARYSKNVGPIAMDLKPLKGTDTCGRSALMIHGDNKAHDASKGCIILAAPIRRAIDKSKDKLLEVVEDNP
jgi:hypothetical protein